MILGMSSYSVEPMMIIVSTGPVLAGVWKNQGEHLIET